MSIIGKFTKTEDGVYTGYINTLQLKASDVRIVPAPEKESVTAPDFRVASAGAEFGAGWNKIAEESGNRYLSLRFDDPSLTAPFSASLFEQEDGTYNLVYSRARRS